MSQARTSHDAASGVAGSAISNDADISPTTSLPGPSSPILPQTATPASGLEDPSPFSRNVTTSDGLQRTSSRRSRQSRNARRASRGSLEYDIPDSYRYLDEVGISPPVQNPAEEPVRHISNREDSYSARSRSRRGSSAAEDMGLPLEQRLSRRMSQISAADRELRMLQRQSSRTRVDYDIPEAYNNLDELAVSPVQNPDESPIYKFHSLEEERSRDREEQQRRRTSRVSGNEPRPSVALPVAQPEENLEEEPQTFRVSRLATQLYTISYLVFFSFLGTLARIGLGALTIYPGAPVIFASIWPNFAGSIVMGFLSEDRMLFRFEWGTPTYENQLREAREKSRGEEGGSGSSDTPNVDLAAARKAYMATKKTIPLYIGLATGFCGSFTSFSAFIKDCFLALSNDIAAPGTETSIPRNGGYSFMALLGVVIITTTLSLGGLFIGAHLAITLEPITPSLPYSFTRKVLDRSVVFLAWGCWTGAILLSALPPDRNDPGPEIWRGTATFSLVFAPLGCLARFYLSLYLNGRFGAFPLGTFTANVGGTAVLGMAWDLAHASIGGVVGCQVLQGIEDGFCGCLTTISTWVAELAVLRRRHAYVYGGASVVVSLAAMIAIMGGLRWTDGFAALSCVH